MYLFKNIGYIYKGLKTAPIPEKMVAVKHNIKVGKSFKVSMPHWKKFTVPRHEVFKTDTSSYVLEIIYYKTFQWRP